MSEPQQPEWEAVNRDSMTYRIRIPGGWLYRLSTYQGVAGVFVPYAAVDRDRTIDNDMKE